MTKARSAVRVALDFGLPVAAYYLLRAAGIGVYVALLVGAVGSAVSAVIPLMRTRHIDGMSAYVSVMMLGAVGVALLPGDTRFLLARDALLTGVTGVWFIASIWSQRPLSYLFTRPMIEGRFGWPPKWDQLWDRSPAFRRMWRVSSLFWGIALLADAALRVVMSYTLRPDVVPALSIALYVATTVVLIVVTNVYYFACGIHNRNSALYRGHNAADPAVAG